MRAALLVSPILLGVVLMACDGSDLSLAGGGGQGGTTTTTSSSSQGGGGQGGTGGAFSGCDSCPPDKPLCVDGKSCEAACPGGRDLCHPAGAPSSGVCCGGEEQCCEASLFGYTNGDLCVADAAACPLGCPGADTTCPLQTYCELDPATQAYSCAPTCPPSRLCGFNVCCPLGSSCVEGACAIADLTVNTMQMAASAHFDVVTFGADSCELFEGCIGAAGTRTLLRFDLATPNIGLGDLFLGSPEGNDLFQFSPCHNHFHFTAYADYQLLDENGDVVAAGHKQAFCLEDIQSLDGSGQNKYTCSFQGIQAGWADVYGGGLPCQWVDVTDVPAGNYTLRASVNYEHLLAESNYENNVGEVPVTVVGNTCPGGCNPVDSACCQPGDPCGFAANGVCDCSNFFGWDDADCGGCLAADPQCTEPSSCPAGCSPNMGPCCADGDPCGLANNYACDCSGAFGWDDADCGQCGSSEPPCPVNTCPNGCTSAGASPDCCVDGNPCNWDGDGYCDCGGLFAWDSQDCSHCTSNNPACP